MLRMSCRQIQSRRGHSLHRLSSKLLLRARQHALRVQRWLHRRFAELHGLPRLRHQPIVKNTPYLVFPLMNKVPRFMIACGIFAVVACACYNHSCCGC